jgi:hypothetical protein
MSQVIAFTQNINFRTLLEVQCKEITGFSPIIHQTFDEFLNMLSLLESIDIIIIDEPSDNSIFVNLLNEVITRQGQFKSIFFRTERNPMLEKSKVFLPQDVESLFNELKSFFKNVENKEQGHISIPIDSLVHFKMLPFDLYVKIGEDKFIKRIPAHEEIDDSTFASFLQKGIVELHYERKYNRDFSVMLINNMINKVEKDYASLDEKLEASNEVYLTTHQIVGKLGFKPKMVEVCDSVLNQIAEDVVKGKDNFSKFLEQLRTKTNLSFRYRLMELTSFIGTQMIEATENGEPHREMIKKLIFSSLFCDITLKHNDQIHVRRPDQVLKLSQVEQKEVNEHALRSSELVNKYQAAPLEASVIIKQHHGSLNGVGIPLEISPKILPLAKCLMAAQEISYQMLLESHRHPIDVLSDVKLRFIDTPLDEYMEIFESSCYENLNLSKNP